MYFGVVQFLLEALAVGSVANKVIEEKHLQSSELVLCYDLQKVSVGLSFVVAVVVLFGTFFERHLCASSFIVNDSLLPRDFFVMENNISQCKKILVCKQVK